MWPALGGAPPRVIAAVLAVLAVLAVVAALLALDAAVLAPMPQPDPVEAAAPGSGVPLGGIHSQVSTQGRGVPSKWGVSLAPDLAHCWAACRPTRHVSPAVQAPTRRLEVTSLKCLEPKWILSCILLFHFISKQA